MRQLTLLCVLGGFALPAAAADDAIAVRQALMDSNGAAAGVAVGIFKGEIPYAPVIGKSAIQAMAAAAAAYGDFFPEGSQDAARSNASPKIWEDRAGFDAELAKFQAATAKAVEASGRAGPADAEAFKAAVEPVLAECTACHKAYRIEN